MTVVRKLGARVETEHSRQLAELRRLEGTSSGAAQRAGVNGVNGASGVTANGEIDFETLVKGAAASTTQIAADPFGDSFDDGPGLSSVRIIRLDPHTRIRQGVTVLSAIGSDLPRPVTRPAHHRPAQHAALPALAATAR
jgi:hypothetical protein